MTENSLMSEGMYVEIHIIDEGTGIPLEIQNQIFDLFFSTKENGSGIGLAVSKKIIDFHWLISYYVR